MFRNASNDLQQWFVSKSRMPLVIRGARQVGKTWLVRDFAKQNNLELIEINFELDPAKQSCFIDNDPKSVLLHLEVVLGKEINCQTTLLFLDEIQAFPIVLAKLRWFKEMMPELAVIVAGSLLEFVLDDHEFSMPVGRISYFHLEPLSFDEFLAVRNKQMSNYLNSYTYHDGEISKVIHEQCIRYLREYILVGGLPAAVNTWLETESLVAVSQMHNDILTTYRDDFARYKGKFAAELFDEVFHFVPKSVGEKFVYSKVNRDCQISTIKKIFNLIAQARVIHKIKAVSGNGIPLEAEVNNKFNKAICLDVGLMLGILGINLSDFKTLDDIILINKGAVAEQLVGQLLRTIEPFYIEPKLYYWQRLQGGSDAEVDYIIQHKATVMPIEVKSGTKGTMQSLHLFMSLKKLSTAIRLSLERPSRVNVSVKISSGDVVEYKLLCMPIYMVGQLRRLLQNE